MIGPALVGQSTDGRGQSAAHHHHDGPDDHDDGYAGAARLITMDHELDVDVVARGFFQPVDGRYRWHGRVFAPEGDLDVLAGRRHTAVLVTPYGQSLCEVYEPDLWGRFKVTGSGTPPFAVDHALPLRAGSAADE